MIGKSKKKCGHRDAQRLCLRVDWRCGNRHNAQRVRSIAYNRGWLRNYLRGVRHILTLVSLLTAIGAGFILVGAASAKGKPVTWKVINDALFRVNDAPVKDWSVYQADKKRDPLLLQIGNRFLLVEVHNHQLFEIDPSKIEHKSEDLIWDPSDHPAQAISTSAWNDSDVGAAFRIEAKINTEASVLVLELPHPQDIGSLPVRSQSPTGRRGRR